MTGSAPGGVQRRFVLGTDVALRTFVGWHVVFYGLIVLAAGLTVAEPDLDASRRGTALALLAAWAVWYRCTAYRFGIDDTDRYGAVYCLGALPLFTGAFLAYGGIGIVLFILYPQTWAFLDGKWKSVLANVVLSAVVAACTALDPEVSSTTAAFQSVVSLGISILFGLWATSIVHQSRGRAEMIEELERTRAQLASVSHDAGVLAERERLAREIHDTLAQGFTSVLMLLEAAQAQVDDAPGEARRHLRLAEETARQNLAEARSLVAALTPVDLQAAPLPEAIGRLVDRFGREVGVAATLDVSGEPRALPAAAEVVLLRCAQEALANVRKHAGAGSTAVTLRYEGEGTVLQVRDDGTGFDPDSPGSGYGLAGMRARVEQVGGTLTITSGPAGGTTVAVAIP